MNRKTLISFDDKLLYFINSNKNKNNITAKSMINEKLAKASDDWGTLLHYAAKAENSEISKFLIELGSNVDCLEKTGKTPLMLCLMFDPAEEYVGYVETVQILLEANANIDITNDLGKSSLQLAFQGNNFEIFRQFINKVLKDSSTFGDAVKKLISSGCNIWHAAHIQDVKTRTEILECMLKLGVNVNCKGKYNESPLHYCAQEGDMALIEFLIDNGADVNAIDDHSKSPLHYATMFGHKEKVEYLLKKGANVNAVDLITGHTPFNIAIRWWCIVEKECYEFIELFIEYGAIPRNPTGNRDAIIDSILSRPCFKVNKLLVEYLAVLEKCGTCKPESVLYCNKEEHQEGLNKLKKDYQLCQKMLERKVFKTISLFDLVVGTESIMRLQVRNEMLVSEVKKFCSEHSLKKSYSYYYKKMMKGISNATEIVKLEDNAIPVVCKLFDSDSNKFYVAARKIVGYLDKSNLEQLLLV